MAMSVGGAQIDAPDLTGEEWAQDPWSCYSAWRDGGDVRWAPRHRSWFVFGHEAVREGLRSADLRSDYAFRATRQAFGPTIVDLEGPEHERLRPPTTARLRTQYLRQDASGWLDQLAGERVREFVAGGGGEVVSGLAIPTVTAVIARVLGLPAADAGWVYETLAPINRYLDTAAGTLAEADAAREELEGYLDRVIREERVEGNGALALLARASAEEELSPAEVLHAGLLLLAAGTETSIGALVNTVDCLCANPDLQDALRTGDLEGARFVHEVLRWEPPMHFSIRYAAAPVELAGTEIPAGAIVQLCLASANRDPAAFPDPDDFDPHRRAARILTFGYGRHGCPGSGLAQSEAGAVLHHLVGASESVTRLAPPEAAPGLMFRRPLALEVEVR